MTEAVQTGKNASVAEGGNEENGKQDCYSYEGDTYIYTDPSTSFQYKWDVEQNKWIPKSDSASASQHVDEAKTKHNYEVVGNTYAYKDEKTGNVFIWDLEAKEWKPKKASKRTKTTNLEEEFDTSDEEETEEKLNKWRDNFNHNVHVDENGIKTYTDPNDGTVLEWDEEKKAWFPKLDDEFLARYQLNYGMETKTEEPRVETEEQKPETKVPKKPVQPTWFEVDDAHNTKVYVSNLPLDLTEQELVEVMQKCGLLEKDVDSGKMKIKLYKDEAGQFKGDALCTYIKVESVELALSILDGSAIRNQTIRVERAKFSLKGEYDPSKKPRKRKKKDAEKLRKKQEKLFDWRPEKLRGQRERHEKVVVLKRLFKPIDFQNSPQLLLEYQQDIREECSKFGQVKKIVIFDRDEEGAAQVVFRTPEEADRCIAFLHGRWFAGHKISAETWDGVTKYKKEETDAERDARLSQWATFLEQEDAD